MCTLYINRTVLVGVGVGGFMATTPEIYIILIFLPFSTVLCNNALINEYCLCLVLRRGSGIVSNLVLVILLHSENYCKVDVLCGSSQFFKPLASSTTLYPMENLIQVSSYLSGPCIHDDQCQ